MGEVIHIHRAPEAPSAWRGTGFAHAPDRPSRAALRAHRRACQPSAAVYTPEIVLLIAIGAGGFVWMLARVMFQAWARG
jgi:hypothetical protein